MKSTSYVNGVAQALSQDFLDAWAQKHGKFGKLLVRAKRRYWDGAAFVYEAAWQTFPMSDFVKVGNITWKLDTPLLNEFKTSSVPIRFKGSMLQLLPTNVGESGFFAPDGVAPLGYEPYHTKFQIQFGYKIPSGDFEMVNLFTGVAVDYLFDPQDGFCEVTVSGNEALLQGADAEEVSTPISGGATTLTGSGEYTSVLPNIARISKVYDAGVEKTQGTHYTISTTSTYGSGAVIKLTYTAAGAITYDGRQWLTLQKIEDLVKALCVQANIEEYTISPVVFVGAPAAVTTNIGLFSGSAWSSVWTNLRWNVSGADGKLTVSAYSSNDYSGSCASTPSLPHVGIWTWKATCSMQTGGGYDNGAIAMMQFMATSQAVACAPGYFIGIIGQSGEVALVKISGNGTGGTSAGSPGAFAFEGTLAVATPSVSPFGTHTWTVTRNQAGFMQVFIDGVLVVSATDNDFTTSSYFQVYVTSSSGTPTTVTIWDIVNQQDIVLTMANFSGMTCYDAIQRLAKLSNYEFLFDADGAMFFRSKTPNSTPVAHIDQSDGISKIMDFRLGHADVRTVARVSNGDYSRQFDSSSLPETAPTSEQRYLKQIQNEDYSEFLLAYDPIIAESRARALQTSECKARRRARLASKIIPQLDLSDVLSFSFLNNPRLADNVFGDPLETWGQSSFGAPSNVLARELPGKVIGIIFNPSECSGEYEVQEILS